MSESITLGKGLTLSYSVDAGSNYVAIAQVIEAEMPHIQYTEAETTAFESANIERVPVWKDPGEASFTLNYTNTLNIAIYTTLYSAASPTFMWKYVLADTHTLVFSGFINDVQWETPLKEQNKIKVKIRCTTMPVLG